MRYRNKIEFNKPVDNKVAFITIVVSLILTATLISIGVSIIVVGF